NEIKPPGRKNRQFFLLVAGTPITVTCSVGCIVDAKTLPLTIKRGSVMALKEDVGRKYKGSEDANGT
ncbi:MAG: hypothetical protein K5985_02085, partial [Lachnospiraceae bacterium]|nr:hypothetical protein [Lachnospiraceae bacterium]